MLKLHKNYVLDENQNPYAVMIPIADFEIIEKILENHNLTEAFKNTDSKRYSGSYIFGMLKHRKLKHPVSTDKMNEAIRKRRYDCL